MSTKRKQVYAAVAGSVGIHLVVLFAWALTVQWFPGAQAAISQPPEEIKLQVVEEKPDVPPTPEPEPTPTPAAPKRLVFKDTEDMPEASQAPKEAVVQSEKNAEAASEMPAAGDKPLPTQKGRPVPHFNFDTHPFTPGDEGRVAGQNVPENMPPPVLDTAPPLPRPVATPLAQSSPPPPTPAATPAASVADPRDVAMLTPQSIPSTPADAEPNPYDPSFRPPTGITEPPRPTPVPRRGGYRPQSERTASVGSTGKLGADSIASEMTPGGVYIASVKRAANLRYTRYVDARADVVSAGVVGVHFTVDRNGKVIRARVVSNNANEATASVSLRAVTDAQIPPMSAEVVADFPSGMLDMTIYFNLENGRN